MAMQTIKVEANSVFAPVHQSRHRYVVMKGSAASGKSTDTAYQYIIRLMRDKGRNLLCVRKSEITHRHSTFAELSSAISSMGVGNVWETRLNPLELRCNNGNRIIFKGINNPKEREKLKSITFAEGKLTDVWIEEASEITQDDFEIIDDRLRGELPANQFYQIKMTFNPVSAHSWLKKLFFDTASPDVLTNHSTYRDNRFVDRAYYARMERRKLTDPEGYRVYGLGDWGEIGGLILHNWKPAVCEQDLNFYDDVTMGQDFGFNHANAILLLGFKDDNVYVLKEIYVHEKEPSEIVPLAEAVNLPKQKIMWYDSASQGQHVVWQRAGYRAMPVKKGDGSVKGQIRWLNDRKIYIDASCVNTIKEAQQWKYQKDEKSGMYLDEPVKVFDDAMAALRYGIEGQRKGCKAQILDKGSLGVY